MTEPFPCQECGDTYPSRKAADDCALLDATEARQNHRAHTKRKPHDDGIIRH